MAPSRRGAQQRKNHMRMRTWTIIGIIIGPIVLALAVALTAQEPRVYLNLPGLALVLGGTIAATLASYSFGEIHAALRAVAATFGTKDHADRSDLRDIVRIAKIWSGGDVQATEAAIARVDSPFVQTGLQLIIECAPRDQLIDVLDWRIDRLKAHGYAEADVFNVMAVYAPAFGMVGTLLGLVNMLGEMGGGVDEIGASLAMALVTTFYGIVLANAVFKPLSVNLRRRTQDRMAILAAAKEALVMMADQRSAVQLKYALSAFVDPDDPDLIEPTPLTERTADAHA